MSSQPADAVPLDEPAQDLFLKHSITDISNEEEQNYCRICRGEGTTAQPLYYPCKCSGSIKFVHQECLMEWLSHSQKKYCELCKTSFRFTKLYDRSMPARLPFPLFVRQLARHGAREAMRWTRYLLVGTIWICCLPWCIRQVWRGFLWLADGTTPSEADMQAFVDNIANETATATTYPVSQTTTANLTRPESLSLITRGLPLVLSSVRDIAGAYLGNSFFGRIIGYILALFMPQRGRADQDVGRQELHTEIPATFERSSSLLSNVEFISNWSASPVVNNATVDIIEGQLICVLLVTAFILVFLIREWVINQQPIMNMPDQDAPENPLQERQVQDERPRRALRRHRNHRHGADVNAQAEGAVPAEPVVRPLATPMRRRALTDDNILNDTGNVIARPNLPLRSQSLLTDADDTEHSATEAGLEGDSMFAGTSERHSTRRPSSSSHPSIETAATIGSDPHELAARFESLSAMPASLDQPLTEYESGHIGHSEGAASSNLPISDMDSAAAPRGQEPHKDANDSDSPAIATPESSNATETLHPNGDATFADMQEALSDDGGVTDAEEVAAPIIPEQPEDKSLPARLSKWLWDTEVEIDVPAGTEAPINPLVNALDDERVVDDVNAEAPFVPVHHRGPVEMPALPPANAERPAPPREPNMFMGVDLNDAGDDAEDLDGVLELLGMEGPIFGMVQNVIFSLLLITITLMMSFWFPYMWGKIALLFLSQPMTMLIRAPLFVLSNCADIVVDVIFFVAGLTGLVLNQPMKAIKASIGGFLPSVAGVLDTSTIEGYTLDLSQRSGLRLEQTLSAAILGLKPDVPNFSMQSHHALITVKSFVRGTLRSAGLTFLQTQKAMTTDRPSAHVLLRSLRHVFTLVPTAYKRLPQLKQMTTNFVRYGLTSLVTESTLPGSSLDPSLAIWNNEDRVIVIILGYALFAIAGIAFLEIARLVLGLKDGEKVEGYFADSLRQAGGVMKVIVIIGIEMLVFPLYCGLLLDLALLPLFANATVASRVAFMWRTPLTGTFIHWFIGTCYMFHFALFVSICRKIMRKGVLYFIRDPDDPTFHPVRDVLERPVPAQLGKIAFSALIYGGLVTVCLGSVVWSLDWVGGVLPIQWSTPEPRLAFPVDIVFYNFLLPFILRKAEPSKKISTMYKWWFRGCAKSLRLTNFLFGEEAKEEQYTRPNEILWMLTAKDTITAPERDGSFVRAPASDSVRIAKGRDVFLEVDEHNDRVDGRPDSIFGMHGREDPQFAKVYLPPNFKSRITTFIALLWLFAASTGVTFTIGPLLIGRRVTQLLSQSSRPPNDLYAFTVGVHIFAIVGYAIAYARPAQKYLMARLNSSGKQIVSSVLHTLGLAYLGIFTGIVLPFVMALVTELYVHMPIFDMLELVSQEKMKDVSSSLASNTTKAQSGTDKAVLPSATIYILQSWTIGLLYLRILLRILTHTIEPTSRPARAIRAITRNGIFQADIALASRAFVLPVTAVCLVLLLLPLTYMKVVITVLGVSDTARQMRMYRFAYPLFLWMVVNYAGMMFMRTKLERWRVRIRDEVYLIGERLHNFQEPKKGARVSSSTRKGGERAM